MTDTPTSAAPALLSDADLSLGLDRQKRLAKRLRDDLRDGAPEALDRLKRHHPRADRLSPETIKLSDAQLVIAREAGTQSWPALKAHVSGLDLARRAIEVRAPAPDADIPTLHVRCGNDIEAGLRQAGFKGDFLCHNDPLCDGPVRADESHFEARVEFMSATYPGLTAADVRRRMAANEAQLARLPDYPRIVLWFEHDTYDQLCLADVLHRLSRLPRRTLEIVTLDRYPGLGRFIGLGQLAPAGFRHLFASRTSVPEAAFSAGSAVRLALSDQAPLQLHRLAGSSSSALPFMAAAILRHLSELPGQSHGLGFSEHAALKLIAAGAETWGRVFHGFMSAIDPLPYFGDLMFLGLLLRLSRAHNPPLRFLDDPMQGPWGKARLELTGVGHQLLAGDLDFGACGPEQRSVGGVVCFTDQDWRWDAQAGMPVACEKA